MDECIQGQENAACESRPAWLSVALSLVCLDSATHIGFHAVLASLLANPITHTHACTHAHTRTYK